jgi:hypothetical protein
MSTSPAKGTAAVVLILVGWVIVYLSVAHSWALLTARETIVGPAGHVLSEVVRIAPALLYFVVVGLVMALLFGSFAGARWAALATAIAMALEALAEQHTFFGGIDALAVAVLIVNYLLPIGVAIGGALIARLWEGPRSGTVAT